MISKPAATMKRIPDPLALPSRKRPIQEAPMTGNGHKPPVKSPGDILRKRKRPPDDLLREIVLSRGGIVAAVAAALDVAPRSVRTWRERSPRVRAMFEAAQLASVDMA
jgi:hypothetical protein